VGGGGRIEKSTEADDLEHPYRLVRVPAEGRLGWSGGVERWGGWRGREEVKGAVLARSQQISAPCVR
jgi:hypothetical protein